MTRTKMHFPELPFYLEAYKVVDPDTDTVHVEVESSVHVNRLVRLPGSYSTKYVSCRYRDFMGGVLTSIVRRYDLKPEPLRYL